MLKKRKGLISFFVIFAVIFADQALKIWVKTHMELHDSIKITNWFYICFVENKGMAFGLEFFSKIFLTLFRLVAGGFLIYYLVMLCRKPTAKTGYCISIALIIAGAIGNVLDCMFYGLIFDDSVGHIATLFPAGGGYGSFMYGKVVDMFYFPLIQSAWPSWMPFVSGEQFVFFSPVFNIADSAITVAVFLILIFFRKDVSAALDNKKSK